MIADAADEKAAAARVSSLVKGEEIAADPDVLFDEIDEVRLQPPGGRKSMSVSAQDVVAVSGHRPLPRDENLVRKRAAAGHLQHLPRRSFIGEEDHMVRARRGRGEAAQSDGQEVGASPTGNQNDVHARRAA